jgi:hypothetical protein
MKLETIADGCDRRSGLRLTQHASVRLHGRRFNRDCVEMALGFGREIHVKGITFFVVGRKEVLAAREAGFDLSKAEGMHVLCSREGAIVTMYRNHDLKNTRPGRGARRRRKRNPRSHSGIQE